MGRWKGVAMALLLTPLMTRAEGPQIKVERIGQPCLAKQVLGGCIVRDPQSGTERFVVTNMNEASGAELILIDPEHDRAELFHAPAGAGSWAILPAPNDRLVVGTYYDGNFMVFDLRQRRFIQHIRLANEEYIWNLAYGSDGRLYGGTYPGGKLGAFDLKTGTAEDCGAPAPPNLYLRYVSPTPDGRVLCSFGMEKPTTRLYDPRTKRFSDVPATLHGVTQGCVWNDLFLAGSQIYQGPDFKVVPPFFPTPPTDKGGWAVDVALTTPEMLFLWQGQTLYRFRKGDKELTRVADIDLRGGRCLAANDRGEVFGIRGQDYFVLRPGDRTLRLRRIPVESGPRPTHFLRCDDQGHLWGGPPFGQTLFTFDTHSHRTTNTGAVCDAGGEVYDVAFHKGKVYAASYAGGDITEYDPARRWDQWGLKNPRPMAKVGDAYIRPIAGIITGSDGRLYSGWMARYGTYGGAVAITEPESGKTELIENPLGAQAIAGLAVDTNSIYLGTALGANGLPDKSGEPPRFGVIDIATHKVTFSHEFPGVSQVRAFAYDGKTRCVAFAVGRKLTVFDTQRRLFIADLPADLPDVGSSTLCTTGDGRIYYGSGKEVIRVNLETGKQERLAELPANVGNVAVRADGTAFASCGTDIYQVDIP
jgi:outer membrane protein assembly factor BamB